MNKIKGKKAFTIIELVIVIATIGMLVLFGMPKLVGYVEKAQLTRIQHDTKIMQDKMEGLLSEQDNGFNNWDNNDKDLGVLIMKKQLYETAGIVRKLDKSHIKFPKYSWTSIDGNLYANLIGYEDVNGDLTEIEEIGLGGPLVSDKLTEITDGYAYKIVPDEYKSEIKTRLKGTFYSNEQGKVYYEPNKSIKSLKPEIAPSCLTPESLEYEFEHTTGTIVKYLGVEQRIVIPSAFLVEGQCWPVRIIGKGAFSRNHPYPPIKDVILPPGLENIEDEAFKDNEIQEVIIPPGVEEIGDDAFNDNPLIDIIIQRPENSIDFGNNPFGPGGSGNITYRSPSNKDLGLTVNPKRDNEGNIITGPNGRPSGSISSGGSGSWGGSSNGDASGERGNGGVIIIPPVIIVDGKEIEITEIDKGAFQGEGIIHVILPNGLQRIEDYAFAGNQLIGVDIPQSVKYIGNYAFAYNELYNGKDYKWTLNYIDFEQEKQIDKINEQLGDIEENGAKVDKVKEANLLAHIWINSNSGFTIPDDYGDVEGESGNVSSLKIVVNPEGYIHTETNISIGYEYSGNVIDVEWSFNGELLDKAPNGKLSEGTHIVRMRILYESGQWTKWVEKKITINKYVVYHMNYPGSTDINHVNYNVGDDLIFNYTNDSNLNWIVPISGVYRIDAQGAGAGGKGARTQGELEFMRGDIVNFKIHSISNGGGFGGGGGGTAVKLNNNNIIIAGGAGGDGARGVGYDLSGIGGTGGDGGYRVGLPGSNGGNSLYFDSWRNRHWYGYGGAGGTETSAGGTGGVQINSINNKQTFYSPGAKGPTIYDGGGGGKADGSSYNPGGGGGGGAGGRSFIDEYIINNHEATDGYNSGDGKVIITLIK